MTRLLRLIVTLAAALILGFVALIMAGRAWGSTRPAELILYFAKPANTAFNPQIKDLPYVPVLYDRVSGGRRSFDQYKFKLIVNMDLASINKRGDVAFTAVFHDGLDFGLNGVMFVWGGISRGLIRVTEMKTDSVEHVWSDDGRLAFKTIVTDKDGFYVKEDVYVWNGTSVTNVSESPGYDQVPNWSIDGRLAFHSVNVEAQTSNLQVWDGKSNSIISGAYQNAGFDFTWSPDGQQVAFTAWPSGTSSTEGSEIFIWDGQIARPITDDKLPKHILIWPNNDSLYYVACGFGRPATGNIYLRTKHGTRTLLPKEVMFECDDESRLELGPTGQIAFAGLQRTDKVWVWDGTVFQYIELTDCLSLAWSYQGQLAAECVIDRNRAIYVWDGHNIRKVGDIGKSGGIPLVWVWTLDGKLLFSTYANGTDDIYMWDGQNTIPITNSPEWDETSPINVSFDKPQRLP